MKESPTKPNPKDDPELDEKRHEFEVNATIQNYLKEGDHVYELYSVMVHSGSALGGHYYTYIKSFEDGHWYDFNDRTVTRISYKEIEKVFGDEVPKKSKRFVFGSDFLYQGCSAYMLSYRSVHTKNSEDYKICELPKSVKEIIEKQREEELRAQEEERKRKEAKEKELLLRIFYKGNDQHIVVWDRTSGAFTEKLRIKLDKIDVSTIVYLEAFNVLATTHHKDFVKFWRFPEGDCIKTVHTPCNTLRNIISLPNYNMVAAADLKTGQVQLISLT